MAAHEADGALPGKQTAQTDRRPVLEVSSLKAGYGRRPVLNGVSIDVAPGQIVALFGHNGAGKTTLLKSVLGSVQPTAGTVTFNGHDITKTSAVQNAKAGVVLIPAENFVFADLTVLDNLRLGAHRAPSRAVAEERLAQVYDLFPILRERTTQLAGTMSGGQQRMLSVGIALMSGPRLLLLDEPSLGLAPALVEQMMAVIGRLAREDGLSVLLVEQNVPMTLASADKAYFMRSGQIILGQSVEELAGRTSYWDLL